MEIDLTLIIRCICFSQRMNVQLAALENDLLESSRNPQFLTAHCRPAGVDHSSRSGAVKPSHWEV